MLTLRLSERRVKHISTIPSDSKVIEDNILTASALTRKRIRDGQKWHTSQPDATEIKDGDISVSFKEEVQQIERFKTNSYVQYAMDIYGNISKW